MSMRQDRCGECGDDFVWDSEAGSAVCPSCGTLQDSSQVLLDTHIEQEDNARERDNFSFYHRTTLKSFRKAQGWDLAGQSTLAAAERNKLAMRELIMALTHRIGHPSLSSRTLFLFELAMQQGRFRYGRKARLVAGASLAIALRENHKGETIKDITYLLNENHIALVHVFRAVTSLLDIKLASVDPSWHLPALQKYLVSLLAGSPSTLPSNLIQVLKSVHLPSAFRTAASLSELVSRSGVSVNLPSQPTACAIYILALEAEILSSLPQCGELAKALGRRFDIGKEVVMRRRRTIYACIEGWAADIPWIGDLKTTSKHKSPAKVSKRASVARCLKDAVQYQESLWKAKLQAIQPLTATNDDNESVSSSEFRVASKIDFKQNVEASASKPPRPRKRRKTGNVNDVSCFLVSPLHTGSTGRTPHIDRVPPLETASHMLTSDTASLKQHPTRLQLLTAAKSADGITDEELFGEGELDSFLRTTEEREALIQTCDWAREKDSDGEPDIAEAHADRAGKSTFDHEFTSRMNIEALGCLLNDPSLNNLAQNTDKDDDDDDNWASNNSVRRVMMRAEGLWDRQGATSVEAGDDSYPAAFPARGDDNEEVLGPWRSLSPDHV